MSLYEVLLIGHILGVVVMAFGSGTAMLASLSAGSRPNVSAVITASRLELLGGRVVSFAAVVVALLGTWLVKEGNFEFSAAWISAGMLVWFLILGVMFGMMAPAEKKLAELSTPAKAEGEQK